MLGHLATTHRETDRLSTMSWDAFNTPGMVTGIDETRKFLLKKGTGHLEEANQLISLDTEFKSRGIGGERVGP